jgi:hypothetical protein
VRRHIVNASDKLADVLASDYMIGPMFRPLMFHEFLFDLDFGALQIDFGVYPYDTS